jgi:hypothetical protein
LLEFNSPIPTFLFPHFRTELSLFSVVPMPLESEQEAAVPGIPLNFTTAVIRSTATFLELELDPAS